jgi:phosphoribosylaminoimidazole (AIR) synthetase
LEINAAFRIFNMGIGMVIVAPAASVAAIQELLPRASVIGRLVEREQTFAPVVLAT